MLILYPTASISGKLVDVRGRAIADVEVAPWSRAEPYRELATGKDVTIQDGSFSIAGLAAGIYRVWLRPTCVRTTTKRAAPPWDEFQLARGQVLKGVTLVFETEAIPELHIAGRVVDPEGMPIEGAEVLALGLGDDTGLFQGLRTNKDGDYDIGWLTEAFYSMSVDHEAYVEARRRNVEAGSEGIDFVLQPRGAIEGHVLDDRTATPIKQFQILHLDEYNKRDSRRRSRFNNYRSEGGAFRIESVYPGPVTVIAKAAGYSESVVDVARVDSGEAVRDTEIRLTAGVSVNGVVQDADGAPIENAYVIPRELSRNEEPVLASETKTDSDGTFHLKHVPPETRVISAYRRGYPIGSSQVTLRAEGENTVTIVISKGGIVEGTVYYGDKPWPGQHVALWASPGGHVGPTETGENGRYRFSKLRPGRVQVWAGGVRTVDQMPEEERRLEQRAIVRDGETTVVDFHFSPATATVEGLVTIEGEPLKGANLNLIVETTDGKETFIGIVKLDGSYRFEDVPAGPAVLSVSDDLSNLRRQVEFEIGEGEVLRQDIEFAAGAAVAGHVTGIGEDQEVLVFIIPKHIDITDANRMQVPFDQISRGLWPTSVRANESYHCGGLDAGPYTVFAMVSDIPGIIDSTAGFIATQVELAENEIFVLDLMFD